MSQYAGMPWHTMSVEELEHHLRTDRARGLGSKLSRSRLERLGRNELFYPEPMTTASCFRTIFSDTSLLLLLLICAIALCFSRWNAVVGVLIVLLISTTITVIAYRKTHQIREAMCAYSAPRVHVVRAGQHLLADAAMIVPGDLLVLGRGDVAPCDIRLFYGTGDLRAEVLLFGTDQLPQRVVAQKSTDPIGARDSVPVLPLRDNMLSAGSVLLDGVAWGFAVATGEDSYAGSVCGAHSLCSQLGEVPSVLQMKRYVNRYSLGMCVLLLPITLIGLLAGGGALQIFDVFFIALSLGVASMSEQLMVMGRIVAACGMMRAALKNPTEKAAIIKKNTALEALGQMTDLFVFGTIAAADAHMHPVALYTGDEIYHNGRWHGDEITRLYTLAYLFSKGTRSLPGVSAPQRSARHVLGAMLDGIKEMQSKTSFDAVATDIRTVSLTASVEHVGGIDIVMRLPDNSVERSCVLCVTDETLICRCSHKIRGGELVALDEAGRALLLSIYRKFLTQGSRTLSVATVRDGNTIFEGLFVFREAYDPDLNENLEQLSGSGVRTTLFLPDEDAYDVRLLINSGWIRSENEVITASRLRSRGDSLATVFEKYRVFAGLREEQIVELAALCRTKKRTLACLSLSLQQELLPYTSLLVGCDDRTFVADAGIDADKKPTPLQDPSVRERRCSDSAVVQRADVLVRCCTKQGGTLDGVVNALYTARAIRRNMVLVLQYLIFTQFLRMTVVLLPLLFGVGAQSAALIVFSGLFVDLGYILILAFHRYDEVDLQAAPRDHAYFAAPFKRRPDWIGASVATGVLITVLGAILKACGIAPIGAGYELFLFLSVILSQTLVILFFLQSSSPASSSRLSKLTVAGVFGVVLVAALLISCVPGLAALFGCGGMSLKLLLFSLMTIPFFGASVLLSRWIAPRLGGWVKTLWRNRFLRDEQ